MDVGWLVVSIALAMQIKLDTQRTLIICPMAVINNESV